MILTGSRNNTHSDRKLGSGPRAPVLHGAGDQTCSAWRQHIREGRIRFIMQKGRNREPLTVDIPIHPELQQIIEASPTGDLTFLTTEQGRPFTAAGFTNWFRKRCKEAGWLSFRPTACAKLLQHERLSEEQPRASSWEYSAGGISPMAEGYTRAAERHGWLVAQLSCSEQIGLKSFPLLSPRPKCGKKWLEKVANLKLAIRGWWARQDSNLQPDGYEPPALTIELRAPPVNGSRLYSITFGAPVERLRLGIVRTKMWALSDRAAAGIARTHEYFQTGS